MVEVFIIIQKVNKPENQDLLKDEAVGPKDIVLDLLNTIVLVRIELLLCTYNDCFTCDGLFDLADILLNKK